MKFNLIICTYKRPEALKKLLESVTCQHLYPGEILIIDGSPGEETREIIAAEDYPNLQYYKVKESDRGLTRQRNYGIAKTGKEIEIICFLDDDITLEPDYFQQMIETYKMKPHAIGVGGYIIDNIQWEKNDDPPDFSEFAMDGYKRKLGSRNLLRKKLDLLSDAAPGIMPEFSNGLSISFLPPSGKIYPVEFFMGGVASYRRTIFKQLNFSRYFEGYGLYEDMDFCLRASRLGELYVNTSAQVYHYHEESGRPNRFKYGKMVITNGWYAWHVKYPNPKLIAKSKWHANALLLTLVRLGNTFNTSKRREAFTESLGRTVGWFSLFFNSPRPGKAYISR